jgi:hypothetical protein
MLQKLLTYFFAWYEICGIIARTITSQHLTTSRNKIMKVFSLFAAVAAIALFSAAAQADVATISSTVNSPLGYTKGGYVEVQIQAGPALTNGSRTGLIATVYNAAGQAQGSANVWDSDSNGGTINPGTSNYTASNTGFGFSNSAVSYGLSVASNGNINVQLGTGASYNGSFSFLGNKTIANPGNGFNGTVNLGNLWSVLGGNVNWATYSNSGNGGLDIASVSGSSTNDTFAASGTATLPGSWRTYSWKPTGSGGYSKDMIKTGQWGTKTITFGSFVADQADLGIFSGYYNDLLNARGEYDAALASIAAYNADVAAYLAADFVSYDEQLAAYEALVQAEAAATAAYSDAEVYLASAQQAYADYADFGNARNGAGIDNSYSVNSALGAFADILAVETAGDAPAAPAPEPATMLILGLGLAGLGLARRRK